MSKKNSAPAQPAQAPAAPAPLTSGLGNLSEADKAAIRGGGPIIDPTEPPETVGMTATEALLRSEEAADWSHEAPEGEPDLDLVARVATLEHNQVILEKAVQAHAKLLSKPRALAPSEAPAPIIARATPAEEAAYSQANANAANGGHKPFNGLQAWRDAGSPGLTA